MAVGVALVVAGCGSASSPSTSRTAASTKTLTGATTATVVPAGSVAVAGGTPITHAEFIHWMYVAAKSQASSSPGQPAIVPTDPPGFSRCIASVRSQVPSLKKAADRTLRADCTQLFRALSSQVMDYLIKASWIQADAARHGVTPSDAQVERALNDGKQKQFPGGAGFQAFLTKTGQTLQDVRFRFRIDVTLTRLTAREKGTASRRQTAVFAREKREYLPKTRCTPTVLMAECSNYRPG
jgi:hypothetical protein